MLLRRVAMETKKGWEPVADGCLLNDFECYGDYVIAAVLRLPSPY